MIHYLLQGLLVGLAYVAPIGMQNAYVINASAKCSKSRALQIALITIFFDIGLAIACFFGVGLLLSYFPILKQFVMGFGSLAVLYIGVSLIRSTSTGIAETEVNPSLLATCVTVFMVTWLNPQAIIDGTLLLSGFRATLIGTSTYWFISGVALSSAIWFIGLSTLVNRLRHLMTPKVLTNINRLCGIVIIFFGIKIGMQLFA
jgi:L-lysine exporter family protein LysE/ArgO